MVVNNGSKGWFNGLQRLFFSEDATDYIYIAYIIFIQFI